MKKNPHPPRWRRTYLDETRHQRMMRKRKERKLSNSKSKVKEKGRTWRRAHPRHVNIYSRQGYYAQTSLVHGKQPTDRLTLEGTQRQDKRFLIHVSLKMHDLVKEQATQDGRSMAHWIRAAVEERLRTTGVM